MQVQVVNLLVTPEQAEILSLASNGRTRIQLVLLRNPPRHPNRQNAWRGSGVSSVRRRCQATRSARSQAASAWSRMSRCRALLSLRNRSRPAPPVTVEVFNGPKRVGV